MKALIYKKPYLMEIEDIEKPTLDDGEVLVRVEAVGACGSDVHGFAGKTGRRYPGMVMGHEISGIVENISDNVPKSLLGESVVIQPIISCGSCKLCELGLTSVCLNKKMVGVNMGVNGGLSEYLKVPYQNALKINKNVSPQVAAMVEPFAVGEGAVSLLDDSLADKNVCIVGAGTIGLTTLFMTFKRKPKKVFIVDQNARKLKIAESFGAIPINFLTENPKEVIFNQTEGLGVDVVFEAVGVSSSVKSAMSVLRTGGTAVWIGNSERVIELDMQDVVVEMKRIIGTYSYTTENFKAAINYVESNIDVASLFAEEVVSLNEANDLFIKLANGEKDLLRGVVKVS